MTPGKGYTTDGLALTVSAPTIRFPKEPKPPYTPAWMVPGATEQELERERVDHLFRRVQERAFLEYVISEGRNR